MSDKELEDPGYRGSRNDDREEDDDDDGDDDDENDDVEYNIGNDNNVVFPLIPVCLSVHRRLRPCVPASLCNVYARKLAPECDYDHQIVQKVGN